MARPGEDGPAEATSREAGPKDSRLALQVVHQEVQFGATVREEFTRAGMRGEEQLADFLGWRLVFQQGDGLLDPGGFLDHVPGPLGDGFGQGRGGQGFSVRPGQAGQFRLVLAEGLEGGDAFLVAGGVKRVHEVVLEPGVEHLELGVLGKGEGGEGLLPAIDADQFVCLAVGRNSLVEEAAGHAYELVLGPAAEPGELGLVEGVVAQLEEGQGGRQLDRGARAEARGEGEVGGQDELETLSGSQAFFPQGPKYAKRVIGPGLLTLSFRKIVQAGLHHGVLEGFAEESYGGFIAGNGEGAYYAVDGGPEHGSAVVVEVVAEELDTPRGLRHAGVLHEFPIRGDAAFSFLRLVHRQKKPAANRGFLKTGKKYVRLQP